MMLPRLLLLTDRAQLPLSRSLTRTVAECVEAGLTHLVLRELDLSPSQRAGALASLVGVGATVISARTLLPGAVGVHLAADRSVPVGHVRRSPDDSGPDRPALVGRSCHSAAGVASARADYVLLSPYSSGGSKPGREPLAAAAFAGHDVPVYALGGVTPDNAADARAAGAYGVAVMGAVMRSHDPAAVVRALIEAVA